MSRKAWAFSCSLLAVLLLATPATALADCFGGPPLTSLIKQSDGIFVVKLGKPDEHLIVKMDVVKVLKGKRPAAPLRLDLKAMEKGDRREYIRKLIAGRGEKPAAFFTGRIDDHQHASGEPNPELDVRGLLQIDRTWLASESGGKGLWKLVALVPKLQTTWDGGSDTLVQAVEHTLAYPDDAPPVRDDTCWARFFRMGKIAGKVSSMRAIDLDGRRRPLLFVASDGGDRLFAWNAKQETFSDVTAARKLSSQSRIAAWADFNGDGRLDLVSWDGKALLLISQHKDGSFGEGRGLPADFGAECLGLSPLDVGAGNIPGLLVSTPAGAMLLRPAGTGKHRAQRLPLPDGGKLGPAGACLVADFDGDGHPDVLQPFGGGSLVFRGKGSGAFEEPVDCPVVICKGPAVTCVGDFDMDGLLDIFATSKAGNSRSRRYVNIWHNRGKLKFAEVFVHSGEMCYMAQPEITSASLCDVNGDGRQDLLIARPQSEPQFYFNRGYRNFSRATKLAQGDQDVIKAAERGQQAGTVADLNGDGAQDMALIARDGSLHVFLHEMLDAEEEYRDRKWGGVRVLLPASAGRAGPVNVTGRDPRRCLGTWRVTPGSANVFFGARTGEKITLKWRFPGGEELTKIVKVQDANTVVTLEAPTPKTKTPAGEALTNPPPVPAPTKLGSGKSANRLLYWLLAAAGALSVVVTAVWILRRSKR